MDASSVVMFGWTLPSAVQSALLEILLHTIRVFGVAAVCAVALVVHEEAHRLCARATGRRTAGWGFRWYGIGVRIEVGDIRSFWPVPQLDIAEPSAAIGVEKRAFESERLERWFGA